MLKGNFHSFMGRNHIDPTSRGGLLCLLQHDVDLVVVVFRAVIFEDRGDSARAKEFYSRAVQSFPDYTEATERLQQLGGL